VAVVIDTPTIGEGYGGTVSAPVFSELAQQVLEYLGVPHDQPLKTQKQIEEAKKDVEPDFVPDNVGDLNAMFEQINSLPADDPLRDPANAAAMEANEVADAEAERRAAQAAAARAKGPSRSLPEKVLAAFHANGDTTSVISDAALDTSRPLEAPHIQPQVQTRANGAVVVDAGKRVAVPDFAGAGLRSVVQDAGHLGLRVQPVGSGMAHEQVPAAGTMVPLGTEIVVRFAR